MLWVGRGSLKIEQGAVFEMSTEMNTFKSNENRRSSHVEQIEVSYIGWNSVYIHWIHETSARKSHEKWESINLKFSADIQTRKVIHPTQNDGIHRTDIFKSTKEDEKGRKATFMWNVMDQKLKWVRIFFRPNFVWRFSRNSVRRFCSIFDIVKETILSLYCTCLLASLLIHLPLCFWNFRKCTIFFSSHVHCSANVLLSWIVLAHICS
jgi:hypothetical protein